MLVPRHQRAGPIGERGVVRRASAGDEHRAGERALAVDDGVDERLGRGRVEQVVVLDERTLDEVLAAGAGVADRVVTGGDRRGGVGELLEVDECLLDQLGRPNLLLDRHTVDTGQVDRPAGSHGRGQARATGSRGGVGRVDVAVG